jgi:hypothetical protein
VIADIWIAPDNAKYEIWAEIFRIIPV